jgi:hypothetical protein
MAREARVLLWSILLFGALLALAPTAWSFFQLVFLSDPWDVVNASGSACKLRDHPAISNRQGMVAVLREADCAGLFMQGAFYFVVFVHPIGERNTGDNLAFQYAPGVNAPNPTISWKAPTSLAVDAPGPIDQVRIQNSQVNGVNLEYDLGGVRTIWDAFENSF